MMMPENILDIRTRAAFREWLMKNHDRERECWISVKRGKAVPAGSLWYLDAVEEALCFGWIDSTVKNVGGVVLQRFGPRSRGSNWTELNKARFRRLDRLGLMTDSGRAACPGIDDGFVMIPEVLDAFRADRTAWENFSSFPVLYQRVRIDNIQRNKNCRHIFDSRLKKLIEASRRGEMIGDWNDCGRLLD